MAYKHGTYAITGEALGEAAVSADTCLVAIGASKIGSAGDMAVVHSKAEYTSAFGWDGEDYATYTLEGLVDAAFEMGSLAEIVVISCGQSIGTSGAAVTAVAPKIKDIYTTMHKRPSFVVAPVASQTPAVAAALVSAMTDIYGESSVDGQVFAEIDTTMLTTAAIKTEAATFTPSPRLSLFAWEGSKDVAGDLQISAATLYAVLQVQRDAANGSVPFEGASNLVIPFAPDHSNFTFGRVDGNALNEAGINTVIYQDGLRTWGAYLSTYSYSGSTSPDEIHICTQRMINYERDLFLRRWATKIDRAFTRQLKDTILVREQAELDRLVAIGALVGSPRIDFVPADNPLGDVLQGNFVWSMQISPAVPFVSATLKVAFTSSGYQTLVEE